MINSADLIINRFRSAAPWALRHIFISLIVAIFVAFLVIGTWFPAPFLKMSGGLKLFLTVILVDVICGPLLTLLLIHSGKSPKARLIDISLITVIQISALIYGIHTFSQGRPVAVVFEVDRFHVISFADIDESKPELIPGWIKSWGTEPPKMFGVRSAKGLTEMMESVDASLQGVEPGQRPWLWQDYALNAPQIKERARPLEQLLAINPEMVQSIQAAAAKAVMDPFENEVANTSELLWLPVVSRQSMDWVAFIDPRSARIRGYVQADGFGD